MWMSWIVFLLLIWVHRKTGKKRPMGGSGAVGGGGRKGGRSKGGASAGGGGKFTLVLDIIRELVLFVAICSLVFAPLPFGWGTVGSVVGRFLTWLFGGIGGWFGGIPAVIITTALLIVAVFTLVWDIASDHKIDRPAKTALITGPFLAMVAIGPVAEGAQTVVTGVYTTGSNSISTVFGQ